MARGFLSGLAMGGLVSVVASGVASVLAPPPMAPTVGDAAPGVEAPAAVTATDSGEGGSDLDGAPQTTTSAQPSTAPDPDTLAAIDPETQDTAAQPSTGTASGLETPAPTAGDGSVALETDAPVLPSPQALAPMAPQEADDLSISTEPAQPPQPDTETESTAFESPEAAESAPEVPSEEASAPQAEAPQQAPEAPTDRAPAPDTESEAPAAPAQPPAQSEETETAALAPEGRPSVGTPGVSLINREGSVSVRRPSSEAASDEAAPEAEGSAEGAQLPIERYAQPFNPEPEKPLMSIVLIDDGSTAVSGAAGLAALASFPYPLTFAVDASLADAAERVAMYRGKGFETLAMIDLPAGARASDVETTLGATLPQMEGVVGLLGAPSGNLQSSREVSDQVAAYLAQSGHGWLAQPKGLNTAVTLARREGVPTRAVFRDFDGKGQTAVVMRRFLDQAAFKAGQESGVVMLGRMQPETISALLLWGLQDRAGQVALAPISTILRAEE